MLLDLELSLSDFLSSSLISQFTSLIIKPQAIPTQINNDEVSIYIKMSSVLENKRLKGVGEKVRVDEQRMFHRRPAPLWFDSQFELTPKVGTTALLSAPFVGEVSTTEQAELMLMTALLHVISVNEDIPVDSLKGSFSGDVPENSIDRMDIEKVITTESEPLSLLVNLRASMQVFDEISLAKPADKKIINESAIT
ncbi:hypothetical protein GCM10007978_32800 [Shewanella hanedai]|uniref:Uncharacterized protein n=1 Tax=Shewanella hanedai TaxID=25 RepID=A0A553JK60_SHEHA|nr:hypothetical protein [Shewanella hanedai]TRY12829.1 hypothetical protein FN961_18590 [Shewanella hanedai]GGI92734.1 hypothetical protein GCM10007978_32800 [Shewanella hanedai]